MQPKRATVAGMETLADRIAEWTDIIAAAKLELGTVRAHVGSVATRRDPFVVALDEAELELDAAQEEFAAMTEAQVLLAQLAPKLDEPGRVTLALAVGLLCQVDGATRADALAYEVDRLRGLRLKMVGGAN